MYHPRPPLCFLGLLDPPVWHTTLAANGQNPQLQVFLIQHGLYPGSLVRLHTVRRYADDSCTMMGPQPRRAAWAGSPTVRAAPDSPVYVLIKADFTRVRKLGARTAHCASRSHVAGLWYDIRIIPLLRPGLGLFHTTAIQHRRFLVPSSSSRSRHRRARSLPLHYDRPPRAPAP
ncbi:hypothetical protein DFH07DRAFT_572751 [Mycena maculata]|uniref:Uncharacterized protein n=1 Tax=Mycena maculata TaxID=230809 RepID=A0AAD7IS41_9AGAR|nr:hypothetical protein DFH07DRAFT_572751 [Mycena maculata]